MTTENEFSWHEKNYGTNFRITIEALLGIYPEFVSGLTASFGNSIEHLFEP